MAAISRATTTYFILPIFSLTLAGNLARVAALERRTHALRGRQRLRDLVRGHRLDVASKLLSEDVAEMSELMKARRRSTHLGHSGSHHSGVKSESKAAALGNSRAAHPKSIVPEPATADLSRADRRKQNTVIDLLKRIFLYNGLDVNDPKLPNGLAFNGTQTLGKQQENDAESIPVLDAIVRKLFFNGDEDAQKVKPFHNDTDDENGLDYLIRLLLFNGVDFKHQKLEDIWSNSSAEQALVEASENQTSQPRPRTPVALAAAQTLDIIVRALLLNGLDYKLAYDPLNLTSTNGTDESPPNATTLENLPDIIVPGTGDGKASSMFSIGAIFRQSPVLGIAVWIGISIAGICILICLGTSCTVCIFGKDSSSMKRPSNWEDDELYEVWVREKLPKM